MRRKYFILLYVGMIVVSLLVTVAVSVIAKAGSLQKDFFMQFVPNIFFCLLFGLFDLYVISSNLKWGRIKNDTVRIATDLLVTTLVAVALPSVINYWFLEPPSIEMAVRHSLMVIPWNWLVVLQLEIFYYNLKQKELQKEKSLYQFEALKNQINPHFLFNCMNTLASLTYQDANKANRFAKKLSSVYRYLLLTQEYQTVTLDEELRFVSSYAYLEQIRYDNALQVEISVDKKETHRHVIPASVQMLVENAIKHNICTPQLPLLVRITVSETGITVANNIQLRDCVTRTGIGLDNIKRQYALYGSNVSICKSKDEFSVTLPFISLN